MESREERIAKLASTLRASGIAKSDSQARMMAEDMIGVEEHVQKSYEEEHSRAQEYLQTVKNLGTPRPAVQKSVEPLQAEQKQSKQMEELYVTKSVGKPPVPERTSTDFGTKTLRQAFDHDTHNSALEAIKSEISRKEFKSVDDIVPDSVVPQSMLHEDIEIVHDMGAPLESESKSVLHEDIEIVHGIAPEQNVVSEEDVSAAPEVVPVVSAAPEVVKVEETDLFESQKVEDEESDELVQPEAPKLDAQKLVDMMEEDGKLEEHTREIKEKPTNVKPKEAYEENNIDLSSMFDFNKGVVRK